MQTTPTASPRPAIARRVAHITLTALTCAVTLGLGVGAAYLAGQAVADIGRAPAGPAYVLRGAIDVAPPSAGQPVMTALVTLAPREVMRGTAALDRAWLQPAAYRPADGAPVRASSPFQADPASSASDLDCLAAAVYYEARGEPDAGQQAVAQVVLNRVQSRLFPKSVCGVVYQGVGTRTCQFSFACDRALGPPRDAAAWDRARDVAQAALAGRVMPAVGHAVSYHTLALGNLWARSMAEVARIGHHIFYGFLGHAADLIPTAAAPTAGAPKNATTAVVTLSPPLVAASPPVAVVSALPARPAADAPPPSAPTALAAAS